MCQPHAYDGAKETTKSECAMLRAWTLRFVIWFLCIASIFEVVIQRLTFYNSVCHCGKYQTGLYPFESS